MKGIIGLNSDVFCVKWVNNSYENSFSKKITELLGSDIGNIEAFKK